MLYAVSQLPQYPYTPNQQYDATTSVGTIRKQYTMADCQSSPLHFQFSEADAVLLLPHCSA